MKRVALLFVALATTSCGGAGPAFEPSFREYREPEFSEVVADLQREAPHEERPVVALVTDGSPTKLAV